MAESLDQFYDFLFKNQGDDAYIALVKKDGELKPVFCKEKGPLIQDFFNLSPESNKSILLTASIIQQKDHVGEPIIQDRIKNAVKNLSTDGRVEFYPAHFFTF